MFYGSLFRYRIFGDTVKFAELLNATGEGRDLFYFHFISSSAMLGMKIHVSMETKILLDSLGSFILEPRGLIVWEVRVQGTQLVLQTIHRFHNWFSQSWRRPLLGPSPG